MVVWSKPAFGVGEGEYSQYVEFIHNGECDIVLRFQWTPLIENVVVIHAEVTKWSASLFKAWLVDWFEVMSELKWRGVNHILGAKRCLTESDLQHWLHFVEMFGFHYETSIDGTDIHIVHREVE